MPPLPSVTKAFLLACVGVFCFFELFPALEPWFELWPLASGGFMPWQLLSYAFLHGGFTHLLFNMLGLWMFGGELERVWGPRRYTQILVASTLSAAGAQLLFTLPGVQRLFAELTGFPVMMAPTVGASGAIFGLLLSFGMLFPNRIIVPLIPPIPMKAKVFVAIFGGLELILGFSGSSGVAHFAHLGGMLGAWLLIRHWRSPRRR
ncbi:rhomboid family intramembrane serine protease [Pelomonas aquatica]|jgi:membrane associated rhomboid family serine protease|uniref:Rhomboid family intramembrane serine protease n=1 Tax=Pelomonas aquatica TaxID=431058 RepID=A0A9X4LME7_9BURK|nr:rhomboid family intramembrane serine protease [Pelomonas aquatica]MCY4755123.1 rhomboid family intramembrane serine protease [Pelomonas aquatica]MDG0865217.1 rhomboid family intramembrane serine protease [Pelomonas aquatica]